MYKRYASKPGFRDLERNPDGTFSFGPFENIPDIQGHAQYREDAGPDEVAGWFLGCKAENADVFASLVQEAISAVALYRQSYHPEDPDYITEEVKHSKGYLAAVQALKSNFHRLLAFLDKYSTPFFSMRYQGHMLWDTTLPAMLGYFSTMLHNPNNVTVQASTATTFLEMMVGDDLCKMVAFDKPGIEPWGHITCDGSVANLEAMWSARELKFLPIGVKHALNDNVFPGAEGIEVNLPGGGKAPLVSLDNWQLVNLESNVVLGIPADIAIHWKTKEDEPLVWQTLNETYSINTVGTAEFYRKFNLDDIKQPVILVPSTKHYSWPKGMAILGFGTNRVLNTAVDAKARMMMDSTKYKDTLEDNLEYCLGNNVPVILTVAVLGSTEESAVDPLDGILKKREDYRSRGLDFNIHCDAAWGGYVISTVRKDYDIQWPTPPAKKSADEGPFIGDTSLVPISEEVIRQLKHVKECDSVTIDPHKCGYAPYPAGSLCYQNGKMINLVTFGAPYIGSAGELPGVGEFGVEGSKPGASAAAVFLNHSVIRPSVKGYGKLLNLSMINTKIYYCNMLFVAEPDDPFFVVPLPMHPDIDKVKTFVKERIWGRSIREIMTDSETMAFLKDLGPDMNILDYLFNFYTDTVNRTPNPDMSKVNTLTQKVYDKLHIYDKHLSPHKEHDLLVTMTTFHREDYKDAFMNTLAERLYVTDPEPPDINSINCIRSTAMDPWPADTQVGDTCMNFYREVIVPGVRKTVLECLKEMEVIEE
jgi:glutamate/tyrosine decarboxylase-like PLP-dependent enzyme